MCKESQTTSFLDLGPNKVHAIILRQLDPRNRSIQNKNQI